MKGGEHDGGRWWSDAGPFLGVKGSTGSGTSNSTVVFNDQQQTGTSLENVWLFAGRRRLIATVGVCFRPTERHNQKRRHDDS